MALTQSDHHTSHIITYSSRQLWHQQSSLCPLTGFDFFISSTGFWHLCAIHIPSVEGSITFHWNMNWNQNINHSKFSKQQCWWCNYKVISMISNTSIIWFQTHSTRNHGRTISLCLRSWWFSYKLWVSYLVQSCKHNTSDNDFVI